MEMGMKPGWNDSDNGRPKGLYKNLVPVPLCTPHPTWVGVGSNFSLCGEMPSANCLIWGNV
jgi:hypothetical protein